MILVQLVKNKDLNVNEATKILEETIREFIHNLRNHKIKD